MPIPGLRRLRPRSFASVRPLVWSLIFVVAVGGLSHPIYADSPDGKSIDTETTAASQKVSANPDDAATWLNLGVELLTAHKYAEAIDALNKSLALKPDEIAYFDRALAYKRSGQAGDSKAYTKAIADASAALALKPNYAVARLLKADAEYAIEAYPEAAADYTQYTSIPGITPDNKAYAQSSALQCAIVLHDYPQVVALSSALMEADPKDPIYYLLYGGGAADLKNYSQAIPALLKYTQLKPKDSQGFYTLGVAYIGSNEKENASLAFEKVLTLSPDNFDAANQSAQLYLTRAIAVKSDASKSVPLFDKAITLFEKAYTIHSKGKEAADTLYNEATALEGKANALKSSAVMKQAIACWTRFFPLASTDPELPKIKAHVERLKYEAGIN